MIAAEESQVGEVEQVEQGTIGDAVANLTGNVIDNAFRLAEQATADGLRVARSASEFLKRLTDV
jgi:hypothetical protein